MDIPEGARGYEGFGGRIGRTWGESEPWWPPARQAPAGAPNIVVVLMDDMGYSDIGPFGSEIATPTLDRLAAHGTRLTNYHTASVCSPARAALLTGLNPHRAGFAHVAAADPGFPGYTMEIAEDVLTLPEVLQQAGYATFAVGKWHLTRDGGIHEAAPRRSWPTQRGFDRFYGSMEGFTDFHFPHRLIMDNSPVEVDQYPEGYYLTDDLTDRAISIIKSLRAHDARKPFFLYFAHNAVHGPLGAKASDIARYRGKYDAGWDILREERFRQQIADGLFPEGTRLPPRNHEPDLDVPAWDGLSDDDRALLARHQEVYAAMIDNVDQNLGRLLATIEALGELENTIVLFTSDNGGTAEGGARGTRSYFGQFLGAAMPRPLPANWPRDVARDPDLIGGPQTAIHYARGWGMASNTPFRLYKGHTFAGGVRAPLLISWPGGGLPQGEIRHEYQYVTDLHPTLLALAGVDRPTERHGKPAKEVDGVSFVSVLHDQTAESAHREQYAEANGNRGFYRDGWKLLTRHQRGAAYDDGEWQLFDVRADPTETENVAAQYPEKVRELAEAWEQAAWTNTVFPLPDASSFRPGRPRRPADAGFTEPVRLLPGTPTLDRHRSARLIALRSFDIDVDLVYADGDAGMLVAHGSQGGGYCLYIEDGRLRFAYNEYGAMHEIDGGPLAPGQRSIRLVAEGLARFRWEFRLLVDGTEVGRLDQVAMLLGLAPFDGIDIGICRRGPVDWGVYQRHGAFRYSGDLRSVTYTSGASAPYDPVTVKHATQEATRAYE
jgi:arylsulfatase A-like enzyme